MRTSKWIYCIIKPAGVFLLCHITLRSLEVLVVAYLEENANENVTCIDFEQTSNFNTLSLSTYLLFQFPVPIKYFL